VAEQKTDDNVALDSTGTMKTASQLIKLIRPLFSCVMVVQTQKQLTVKVSEV
jgi:hypothetical protein